MLFGKHCVGLGATLLVGVMQVVTATGSEAGFTVELLDAGTSPPARVVRQPR